MHNLPPLPTEGFVWNDPEYGDIPVAYTYEQMKAYATEAVNAVLADIEARMVAADMRINAMKNTGELRQREDHAALVAQIREQQ